MVRSTVGPLVRAARLRRGRSQLDLASAIGISQRHLSFVELGKARPSPEVLALIGDRLDVPVHEQNRWFVAAGHAPRHRRTSLDDEAMGHLRSTLQQVVDAHEPAPGVVIDGCWTVQLTNSAAVALADGIPAHARGVPTNIFRIGLHPDGFAPRTVNFAEWSAYLLRQLAQAVERDGRPGLVELAREVEHWPAIPPRDRWPDLDVGDRWPVVPWQLRVGDDVLSFFSTLSTFAAPNDVTIAELAIELFLPADPATERSLRALADERADDRVVVHGG